MFPYVTYTDPYQSLFPRKINVGFIYTGNEQSSMYQHLGHCEKALQMIFGNVEALFSSDTYQFEDYSKVVSDRFDPEKKAKRRKEVFPVDCEKAFAIGVRFAGA